MTTKDNTGDKLIASIRRTKTAGAAPDPGSARAPGTSPRRPRVAKKKPVAAKSSAASTVARDRYQSEGRVWPD